MQAEWAELQAKIQAKRLQRQATMAGKKEERQILGQELDRSAPFLQYGWPDVPSTKTNRFLPKSFNDTNDQTQAMITNQAFREVPGNAINY